MNEVPSHPSERKEIIRNLFKGLPENEQKKVLELTRKPWVTPTTSQIENLNEPITWIQVSGITKYGFVSWGCFEGIGSLLVLLQEDYINFWVDVWPGEGETERRAYLNAVILKNWPEAQPYERALN